MSLFLLPTESWLKPSVEQLYREHLSLGSQVYVEGQSSASFIFRQWEIRFIQQTDRQGIAASARFY